MILITKRTSSISTTKILNVTLLGERRSDGLCSYFFNMLDASAYAIYMYILLNIYGVSCDRKSFLKSLSLYVVKKVLCLAMPTTNIFQNQQEVMQCFPIFCLRSRICRFDKIVNLLGEVKSSLR